MPGIKTRCLLLGCVEMNSSLVYFVSAVNSFGENVGTLLMMEHS